MLRCLAPKKLKVSHIFTISLSKPGIYSSHASPVRGSLGRAGDLDPGGGDEGLTIEMICRTM